MSLSRTTRVVSMQSCLILAVTGCSGSSNESSSGPGTDVGGVNGITGGNSSSGNPGLGGTTATGTNNTAGRLGVGGTNATGGAAMGGSAATGGATGGSSALGGNRSTGGATSTGGKSAAAGGNASGGAAPTGGAVATGGATGTTRATGGAASVGGSSTGGSKSSGGVASMGGSKATTGGATSQGNCTFTANPSISSKMGTVGVVEWSTTLPSVSSAQIVYTLNNAASSVLNKGGTAPVDLTKTNYHTLLLGLKPSSAYTFHIEATSSNGSSCKSSDYALSTGTLTGAPSITRTATNASAQATGFIITSGGVNGPGQAYIIDADGTVVWTAAAPASCSRARMDYEGANMWMMALNVQNSGGEMRTMSMDGVTTQNNISGLSKAHHDFTVLSGGVVATMVWSATGTDPQSDLVERSSDGTVKTVFHIGSNLYVGGQSALGGGSNTYHCNSILYHASDDTYTIGDRNPNMYVRVSHAGQPVWQFGGSCTNAPAPRCATGSWTANHGHHLLDNGNLLFFNNGPFGSASTPSHVYEYSISTTGTSLTATQVKTYTASNNFHSDSLGDVQRLPNGNTLITFSTPSQGQSGMIQEVDASWNVVQTITASAFGYAEWRETLYGPPPR